MTILHIDNAKPQNKCFSDNANDRCSLANNGLEALLDCVNEPNRLHTDNKPIFVYYGVDIGARIEHFFKLIFH